MREFKDVQVQQIQSTATDVNSTLSVYNLQGLGSSICAIRLVISKLLHDPYNEWGRTM